MSKKLYSNIKDLAIDHQLAPGTAMCAGCGGIEAVKIFCEILGSNTVFVNAAGCMTLLTIYPFTPFNGSWLYTAMASAPAGAQGIRDALDILIEKGRLSADEDLKVVVLTGDGSANGIGLSATSAAIDRKLDFIYLCYDNEGYGNTGQQDSAATPFGARTATSSAGRGFTGRKKNLFAIWVANNPAYAATISSAEPLDMARKVAKAMELKGSKLFINHAPCPTGWHFEPHRSIEIGKLAVKTGLWPLKEYYNGKISHTKIVEERTPVEEYLKLQGRFSHLFYPERDDEAINEIQSGIDEYWNTI